jgi:hypothetical protein
MPIKFYEICWLYVSFTVNKRLRRALRKVTQIFLKETSMKKKGILLTTVILLCMGGLAQAQDGGLEVTLDTTWVSKYIWRGFDRLDDKTAFQPSINLDLYDTGLSCNLWSSHAGTSKGAGNVSTVDAEEWRYALTYNNSVLEGEQYQTDYAVGWIYYDFPDMASNDGDAQEFNVTLTWPDLCPAGVVPRYTIIKMWPAEGDGVNNAMGGFIHVVGLGYDLTLPPILPDTTEQIISFTWDMTYNDGTGAGIGAFPAGAVDHDWSHVLWGVSTAVKCGPGTLTPALYYQTSMDDSVNNENEFWVSLSYMVNF